MHRIPICICIGISPEVVCIFFNLTAILNKRYFFVKFLKLGLDLPMYSVLMVIYMDLSMYSVLMLIDFTNKSRRKINYRSNLSKCRLGGVERT